MYTHQTSKLFYAFAAIGLTAKKAGLPLAANEKEQISAGALVAVGPSWKQVGAIAAEQAVRVLRGEKPKDIPFQNFVGATILLNRTVAKEIGFTFPPEIEVLDGKDVPKEWTSP
jgi:putative ABC transport system substrate-binding protein